MAADLDLEAPAVGAAAAAGEVPQTPKTTMTEEGEGAGQAVVARAAAAVMVGMSLMMAGAAGAVNPPRPGPVEAGEALEILAHVAINHCRAPFLGRPKGTLEDPKPPAAQVWDRSQVILLS